MFVSPHKLEIDKEGNVWVVDNGGDQVFKLDRDGKVLMTLGKKGVAGIGADEFDAPTDVAFGVNCDFFVSDGHDRRRHCYPQRAHFEVRQKMGNS